MTTRRPLIGLPGRRKTGAAIVGFPDILRDVDLDVYFADYARGVLDAGGLPVHLPFDASPVELVGELDAIVLPGGADLDPSSYGSTLDAAGPQSAMIDPEPARDRFELALVDGAFEHDVPILGICRGIQVLNVHGGGTLHQHVPEHSRFDVPPATIIHDLVIEPGTELAALYGTSVRVNSLHHQTVDRVADGWIVSARSDDGTIEAMELPDRDVLAVQWHPEMLPTRPTDPVFGWIVERARRRAAQRSNGRGRAVAETGSR